MKVELVVVQGNPEGKRIHLTIPVFRIGRGETCHLRPNSERVSREHAEFAVKDNVFTVRDLGSRNGTLVNGKPIEDLTVLARGDQVTVGPLTFAVSFDGDQSPATPAPAAPVAAPAPAPAAKAAAPTNDIASWLFDEKPAEEKPSGVYGGDTITINAFKATQGMPASSGITEAAGMDDQGFERQTEAEDEEETPDEFMDEDNPFNVKKKPESTTSAPAQSAKESFKDTSDAASAILRRMMERSKDD
jgi:pSer/pThr/pTyr-binding forkhead associated (FHA) protein